MLEEKHPNRQLATVITVILNKTASRGAVDLVRRFAKNVSTKSLWGHATS